MRKRIDRLGTEDFDTARSYAALGAVLVQMHNCDDALPNLTAARDIWSAELPADDKHLAEVRSSLSKCRS